MEAQAQRASEWQLVRRSEVVRMRDQDIVERIKNILPHPRVDFPKRNMIKYVFQR